MKLYHPTLPDTTVTVDDASADAWVESGWRKTAPKAKDAKKEAPTK